MTYAVQDEQKEIEALKEANARREARMGAVDAAPAAERAKKTLTHKASEINDRSTISITRDGPWRPPGHAGCKRAR